MTYEGALVLPENCVAMQEEEMMYTEGGYVLTKTSTAKILKNDAAGLMVAWGALAGGFSVVAATTAATIVGLPGSVLAGIGAAYCLYVANECRQAYNYYSTKSQTATTKYYMKTISLLGFVTGITYGKS